ncbi:hypothetical protein BKA80DRAFT_277153 [Phyllosticta citrichinensis]
MGIARPERTCRYKARLRALLALLASSCRIRSPTLANDDPTCFVKRQDARSNDGRIMRRRLCFPGRHETIIGSDVGVPAEKPGGIRPDWRLNMDIQERGFLFQWTSCRGKAVAVAGAAGVDLGLLLHDHV